MMDEARSSETLVSNNPENQEIYLHQRGNLKSHNLEKNHRIMMVMMMINLRNILQRSEVRLNN
jgi:hypothetical protein